MGPGNGTIDEINNMYFYHRTVMVWIRSCAYLFVWAQLQYLTLSLSCARYYHIYPEGTPDPVYYTWSIFNSVMIHNDGIYNAQTISFTGL